MISETPVVSTPTGAAVDAIEHEVNGYLVPAREPSEIVKGVLQVMNNNPKQMGAAGRKRGLELYDFEIMWQRHLALYTQATL